LLKTIFLNIYCLGAAAWILVLAALLGKRFLRYCKFPKIENLTIEGTALGLGCISYLVFFTGLLGFFSRTGFLLLIVVLTLLLFERGHRGDRVENLYRAKSRYPFPWWMTAISLFVLSLFIYNSFIPDQFYDVLQYHLALPQSYLTLGRYVPTPTNAYSGFPQLAEMLYGLGLGLGKPDNIPLLLQASAGFLIAATLFREMKTVQEGFLACILWISCPLVIELMRFAKPDIFFTLFITLAFCSLLKWKEDQESGRILLCGIFTGLACSTKLTGVLFSGFFFICVLLFSRRSASLSSMIRFILPQILLFLPWAVKNIFYFGNPLFPFLQSTFGTFHTYPGSALYLNALETGVSGLKEFFTFLPRLTWSGHTYPSMNYLGPLWLGFLPFAAYISFKDVKSRWLGIFVLFFYTANAFINHNYARYFFFPVLPIFTILIVRSIYFYQRRTIKLLIFSILFGSLLANIIGWKPFLERLAYGRHALWGMPRERIEKLFAPGYYDSVEWINNNLGENSRTLFIGETKTHLFRRKIVAPSIENIHPLSPMLQQSQNERDLYKAMQREGFTHILFNSSEYQRLRGYPMFQWRPEDPSILAAFWKKHLEKIFESQPMVLYKLTEQSSQKHKLPSALSETFIALSKHEE